MQKIDLHIHTCTTDSEEDFDFDEQLLLDYVSQNQIDIIAITNHNYFEEDNFVKVTDLLASTECAVLPGMELDALGTHILIIGETSDTQLFIDASNRLQAEVEGPKTEEELLSLFPTLSKLIVIPHFHKDPEISQETLDALGDYVDALETTSLKKAMMLTEAKVSEYPIVSFTDHRFGGNGRPTHKPMYVLTDNPTCSAVKAAFRSLDRVRFNTEGTLQFEIAPGVLASEGLNLVVGRRSSGKTVTLGKIEGLCDDDQVYSFPQGSLVADSQEDEFYENLRKQYKDELDSYYNLWDTILDALKNDGTKAERKETIKNYLSELKDYAETSTLADQYSKCPLFTGKKIDVPEIGEITNLVAAAESLLRTEEYKELIDKYINESSLLGLLEELVQVAKKESIRARSVTEANKIISSVKAFLSTHSVQSKYPERILEEVASAQVRASRACKLLGRCWQQGVILDDGGTISEKYKLQISIKKFDKAEQVKEAVGTKESLAGICKKAEDEYIEQLLSLGEAVRLSKGLFHLKIGVVDDKGSKPSGGQRTEFTFLTRLQQAFEYPVVLIDEPESSFDNLFLDEFISEKIRALSKQSTVFVTTHNQVLGYSLKPDKIIFTEYDPDRKSYDLYVAEQTDTVMKGTSEKQPSLKNTVMDLMEAGEDSYEERRHYYEDA